MNQETASMENTTSRPLVSVIIPTLNEKEYIPVLLAALKRQTYTPIEIIVADAGSYDGTLEIAHNSNVKIIKGGLPGIGRNAGAREASGNILLFLDADVCPDQNFISNIVDAFLVNNYAVATCRIRPLEKKLSNEILTVGTNVYFEVIRPISPHAPGFCIISRRSVHERLGGFDETLRISEDMDYARRASRIGKFGIISKVKIPVSMRRVQKEGTLNLGLKYAWCELLGFIGKPVRKPPFEYEFGKFSNPNNH